MDKILKATKDELKTELVDFIIIGPDSAVCTCRCQN